MSDRPRIKYADPVQAMNARLHAHGAPYFSDHVLRELADAVLSCADGIDEIRQWMPREHWADEHAQESLRRHMRFELLDHITRKGHVPTALPVEEIRHTSMQYGLGPPGADVPIESDDYDVVVVTLWCSVRVPPIGVTR